MTTSSARRTTSPRGALIQQTERFRLTSRPAALAFNRSLPCRGLVTKFHDEGATAVATFTLLPRPGVAAQLL